MSRIVRIATTSLATLEAVAPPYNLREPDPETTLALGLSLVDAAGRQGCDLVCLPETFKAAGLPGTRIRDLAEPLDGPTVRALADLARRHRTYVVAGLYAAVDGLVRNVAVLIDRAGHLAGTYAKRHPTEGEMDCGVVPGTELPAFDTDFGRVGLAICFDLNWQSLWTGLKTQRVDLVCWISAYEGGFPLQANACVHGLTVVSSVMPYHARIIERSGRVLAQTTRWGRMTTATLDLEKRWFHTDGQMDAILAVQARYGSRVRVETLGEEHTFSIERTDPGLAMDDIVAAFDLVDYDRYVERCTAAQSEVVARAAALSARP